MRESFRFRPPTVRMTPEVRWLIGRAFGPPDSRLDSGCELDPVLILEAGARLDLLARIAGRTSGEILREECGNKHPVRQKTGKIEQRVPASQGLVAGPPFT